MSTTIDQRVVEMRFDNQQFEKNASNTLSTLDKLKQGLNLTGASKGLENINTAARNVDFSVLGNGVEAVGLKFNAMYSIADQALRNITNSAVNAGKRIVSALTVDPIKSGFSEYETQINAVQTILANTESKGTTLDDVNLALDTLNKYADKTIYNFTEMTRNIGTFTAAGVDLDTSVSSIQGIANLAAVSGSTSQQASTAMYQLSQALASGTVKLQDWNSVVNAGMGGQVFQDALKRTASVMGTNVDALIEKYGSFRESLTQGNWLTTEVLTETLNQFTMAAEEGSAEWDKFKQSLKEKGYTEEQATSILKMANTATDAATKVKTATQLWDTLKEAAQSGWTQTWEIIVGDFEEAKTLWTEVSDTIGDMINKSAESRNSMLEGAMTSNWDKMITKINEAGISTTAFEEKIRELTDSKKINLDNLIEQHGSLEQAFRAGALSSDILKEAVGTLEGALVDLSSIERDLVKGLTGEDVKKAQTALKNLGYDLGKYGVDGKFGVATEKAVKAFQEANNIKVTGIIDEETIAALEKASGNAEGLTESVSGLIDGLDKLGGRELLIESVKNAFNGVMSVVKPIKEAFREIFPPVTSEQLYKLIEGIHEFSEKLKLGGFATANLKRTFKGLFAVVDMIRKIFVAVVQAVMPLTGGLDDLGWRALFVTARWGDWLVKLNETFDATKIVAKAIEKIKTAFSKIVEFLKPIVPIVEDTVSAISDSFSKIGKNAVTRFQPLTALGEALMAIFRGIGAVLQKAMPFISAMAIGIGNVIRDLMNRLTDSIRDADYNAVFDTISGGIMTAIGFFIAKIVKSGSDIIDGAGGFMDNINEILEGASDALGAFTNSLKADTLKKIAVAIAILAASLLVLSLIDSEKLSVALVAISTLFAELMGSMAIFSEVIDSKQLKGISKATIAMMALAAAVLILSIALKIMSTMSWEEMAIGLIATVGGLGALVGAINLLPNKRVKQLGEASKVIRKLAASLVVLAIALKIMGSMSWGELARGLTAMVVGLGAMVAAVHLLPKDMSKQTTGLIALSVAMVILGAALKIMGSMTWDEIARGLVTLGLSLLTVTVAMNYLPKDMMAKAAGMLLVSGALVILGAALKIMASMSLEEGFRSFVVLAASLTAISIAVNSMKGALSGAAAILIVSAALAILAPVLKILGGMTWGEIARGLVALAGAFAVIGIAGLLLGPLVPVLLSLSAAVALFGVGIAAIGLGVLMLGAGLTALAAALGASGGAIVIFVTSLISLIPFLIQQVGVGIIAFCQVIAGSAAAICDAITVILLALIDALTACVPPLLDLIGLILTELLDFILTYAPKIAEVGIKLLIALMEGLAANIGDVIQAGTDLLIAFIDGVANAIPQLVDAGYKAVIDFINGIADAINNNTDALIAAVNNLMDAILNAIGKWFTNFVTKGSEIVDKIIDGLLEHVAAAKSAATDLVSKIIDGVTEKVSEFISIGSDMISGLIDGIRNAASNVVEAAKGVVSDALEAAKNLLGINSPSKEFMKIGEWSDEGLIIGLKKYAGGVADTAADVGGSALSAMSDAISGAADLIGDNMDAQPTIRPVLDLSDIRSGAGAIGGMFGDGYSVGVLANVGSISASMNGNRNASNDDVVSAINSLSEKLGNVGGTTYAINGVTYDDGSNISNAVKDIVRAARVERRI